MSTWCQLICLKNCLGYNQQKGWILAHITESFCTKSPLLKLPQQKLSAVVSGLGVSYVFSSCKKQKTKPPQVSGKDLEAQARIRSCGGWFLDCKEPDGLGNPTGTPFFSSRLKDQPVRQDRPVNCNLPLLQPEFVSKIDFAEGEERRNVRSKWQEGFLASSWWTVLKRKIQPGVKGSLNLIVVSIFFLNVSFSEK